MSNPISIAELKRRLTPGTKLRLVYRSDDGAKNSPREVTRVQSNGVWMIGPGGETNLPFLKGAHAVEIPGGFELHWSQRSDGINTTARFLRYLFESPLAAQSDPEYQTRLDAERVTWELASKSTRRLDAGKRPMNESPLFGGAAQEEMFR